MQKQTSNKATAAAVATQPAAPNLRALRIAAVQAALVAKRVAAKQAKYLAAQAAFTAQQDLLAKHAAYQLQVAQLQAQYGIAPTQHAAPRANSATVKPSGTAILVNGVHYTPCKAVHAIAALHAGNRKATLAACTAAGINPATAATQYGIYKKKVSTN